MTGSGCCAPTAKKSAPSAKTPRILRRPTREIKNYAFTCRAGLSRHSNASAEALCESGFVFRILSLMKEFLEFIIRQLVEFPDDMVLTEIPGGKMTIFKVQLRQADVGRIIGRTGQTIHAIRALLNSSASRNGQRATLEIVE